jgi:hypothetical protein
MNLDEWNDALLGDLELRGVAGQRLYFYVDRELLGRLSGLGPAEAVEDFCKAFHAVTGKVAFRAAADAAALWAARGFTGRPSFVAHLALTVLAVTEEPIGSAHGIYRRQNELLGLPAEPVAPPGSGDDVPRLWRVWNAWLDGPGAAYGRSSARTHPHWTLQGWARSQGLVRHTDRRRIERFLEDFAASSSAAPSVSMLRQWLQYRGASGRELLAKLDDEAAQHVVQDVIDDELTRLRRDGPRATQVGRDRGLLCYDDWTHAFCGAVRLDSAWYGEPLRLASDDVYVPSELDDDFVRFRLAVADAQLLRDGAEHRLTDHVTVQVGGDDVYVMRDEPSVEGRLQCRSVDPAANFHILTRRSRAADIRQALEHAGANADADARDSAVDGWVWFDNVRLDADSESLRLLGLAPLLPNATGRPRLEGGLRVAAATYLVGGEPDVVVPANLGTDVSIDGKPLRGDDSQRRFALATRCLDPGEHTLTAGATRVTFRTASLVKEVAGSGGVVRPVRFADDGFRFDPPVRDPGTTTSVAGARVAGADAPQPLAIRCPPSGGEFLMLTEEGDVCEIWPRSPTWLVRIGLQPSAVDVLDAVRTSASPAAFLLVRAGRRFRGIAIPAFTPRQAGRVSRRPRRDLVGQLVADRWTWVGPPDEQRANRVLSLAMRGGGGHREAPPGVRPARQTEATVRRDIQLGPQINNPYDDILAWLSEQEHGRVAVTAFSQTWAWLCRLHGHTRMAGNWRGALSTLGLLGHLEYDKARRQVAVAPATVVALPRAAGLSVLTGARPTRLLERMDDTDDADHNVAAAAAVWTLHVRTPTSLDEEPAGPCAVFVEWDHAEREVIESGLCQLGVLVNGCTSDWLLRMHPSLDQSIRRAQRFAMSPGREPWAYHRDATGRWQWSPRAVDAGPGLYRYPIARGDIYAWRESPEQPLAEVERATGLWLARAAIGQTSLLVHQPVSRLLLSPAEVRLPELIGRALALRSGLPPYRAHRRGTDTTYLVYENVDAATAYEVARLLRQDIETDESPPRRDR